MNQGELLASLTGVQGCGKIEIREHSSSGKLLGEINFDSTSKKAMKQTVSCKLNKGVGATNIILIFQGNLVTNMELDYIQFR